jgi:hypothetical protein
MPDFVQGSRICRVACRDPVPGQIDYERLWYASETALEVNRRMGTKVLQTGVRKTSCPGRQTVQISECRVGIGAAVDFKVILPSGVMLDKASFRSLGGSPASAGLPHFQEQLSGNEPGPGDIGQERLDVAGNLPLV